MYDAIPQGGMNVMYKNTDLISASAAANKPELRIRKEFPESWIYESLDDLGFVFFANFKRVLIFFDVWVHWVFVTAQFLLHNFTQIRQ